MRQEQQAVQAVDDLQDLAVGDQVPPQRNQNDADAEGALERHAAARAVRRAHHLHDWKQHDRVKTGTMGTIPVCEFGLRSGLLSTNEEDSVPTVPTPYRKRSAKKL